MDVDPTPDANAEQADTADLERLLAHLSRRAELFARHQCRDDPDMSPADRHQLLRSQLEEDPDDFLGRYHRHVPAGMADCLQRWLLHRRRTTAGAEEAADSEAEEFYLAAIRRSGRPAQRKNRRYQALQQLIAGGEYFSDESMRSREPYLYHRYIGRHRPTAEAAAEAVRVGSTNPDTAMSHFLLRHCDRVDENARFDTAAEAAAGGEASSVDSEEDGEESDEPRFLGERERQLLRAEFTSLMHRRFLAGEDADYFDYAAVDADDGLDVSEQFLRDSEDGYFDSEEPS